MGKFKFAPCAFGLAAAVVFSANPVGVHAAPVTTTKMEVSYGDLDIQGKIIYTATEEVASPFYKKGISTAEDCVMIRKEPNAESEAVGKLYSGAGFEVVEDGKEWIRIQSGSCEGYVSAQYVVTGKDAEKAARNTDSASSYAKVIETSVEIKAQASDDAEVVATVENDAVLDVIEVLPESEWTKVQTNGIEGYVKNHTVEVGVDYAAAVSIEEEAEREAAESKAAEETVKETETAEETKAPAEETKAPAEETEASTEETKAPAEETEAPVEETEAPVEETEAPAEDPVVEDSLYIEDTNETVWTTDAVNVRAEADASSARVGGLDKNSSITRTGVCENGWSRVDYNGTSAYIHSDYLTTSEPVQEEPSYDNSSSNSGVGQQMVSFARQFIGNPYVYGGTSLTNGADCSGFVQSIYSNFGYSIPRTATTQYAFGRKIAVEEAQAGDLLFYSYYGEIEHVALYTGEGTIVHASTEETGIIETPMDYGGYPSHAVRIIE